MNHCLRIADRAVQFFTRDPTLELGVSGPSAKFLVDDVATPDVRVEVKWIEPGPSAPRKTKFDSGGVWKLYEDGGRHRFELSSPKFPGGPYKVALFDDDFTRGEIQLSRECFAPHGPIYPLEFPLDE